MESKEQERLLRISLQICGAIVLIILVSGLWGGFSVDDGVFYQILRILRFVLKFFPKRTIVYANDSSEASTTMKLDTSSAWMEALEPADRATPEQISEIRRQAYFLFNIARKKAVCESVFERYMEPLGLPNCSAGGAIAILKRVTKLQMKYWSYGNHTRFKFETKKGIEELYSILWKEDD